jgi:PmbA protein
MLDKVLEIAEKNLKGYQWEIFYLKNKKLKAESNDFKLEKVSSAEDSGFSIRVLNENRQGFAYSTSFTDEAIKETIETAKALSEITSPDEGNYLLDKLENSEKVEFFDTFAVNLPFEEKVEKAIELEKLVKQKDERIKAVRSSTFIENIVYTSLVNSYGVKIEEKGTYYTAMVSAVAVENSDSQIAWSYNATRFLSDLNLDDIASEAVFHATSLLNAKTIPTKKMTVLLAPHAMTEILSTFSYAFTADALIKGKTLFKDKLEEKVASKKLSIVDNGRYPKGLYSSSYDAEGSVKRKNVLVENGIFKGFLHNLYTAKKLGLSSTGNAVRRDFRSLPSVDITNFYIEKGSDDIKSFLNDSDEVLYIIDLMGLHTADPISGEFSLGASGIIYHKGEIVKSVRGITIAGNFLDILNKVILVGEDLKFYGNVGSPSVVVEGLTVAGD